MVKVHLEGLKIARAKGKYYVYVRSTGKALLKGFDGDKAALVKRLAMPDMIGAYNVQRKRDPKSYPERTLGWLVHWFLNECPEYAAMSEATKEDYSAALAYLEPEYDCPLEDITQASLYAVRNDCAKAKWPTFADKVITALSSMFKHGGDYDQQPTHYTLTPIGAIFTQSVARIQESAPTRAEADAFYQRMVENARKGDANDRLYQLEASMEYDPSARLDRIKARILAINFADDELNPPQLGTLEKAMARLPAGRFTVLPATATSRGHYSAQQAARWAPLLADFLRDQ